MTTIITWIIFGIVVVALVAWVETELLSTVYRAGYVRGMEDAGARYASWETKVEQQVEEVRQEIRQEDEGRGA